MRRLASFFLPASCDDDSALDDVANAEWISGMLILFENTETSVARTPSGVWHSPTYVS
jgi:hypothetical protein